VALGDMERHKLVCNSRPKEMPAYYVKDVNVARPNLPSPVSSTPSENGAAKVPDQTPRQRFLSMPRPEFDALAAKVRRIYAQMIRKDFEVLVQEHPVMRERVEKSHRGKHALQQSSLIGHMDRIGLLAKGNTFIEFGCGKGELSNYVFLAVGDPSWYILIDRQNFRMKFDRVLRGNQAAWTRLSMDIKDLDLDKMEKVNDATLVAISKHLCGAATDVTLRCIGNFLEKDPTAKIDGIVIALCCHQVCRYSMYVNPEYLAEVGISEPEFEMICVMSTWGVCGPKVEKAKEKADGPAEKKRKVDEEGDDDEVQEHVVENLDGDADDG
ncbi:methyltransferase TRM13-domain-containing protein, partial [Blyttiomyces helicus]